MIVALIPVIYLQRVKTIPELNPIIDWFFGPKRDMYIYTLIYTHTHTKKNAYIYCIYCNIYIYYNIWPNRLDEINRLTTEHTELILGELYINLAEDMLQVQHVRFNKSILVDVPELFHMFSPELTIFAFAYIKYLHYIIAYYVNYVISF
jgi:hypothetical protein